MTAIHFILESLYTIQFGQSFLGLLPDLIADALLVTGGVLVLKNSNAIGILCGAWGFTFCLHYRSWAWRFESVQDGSERQFIVLFTRLLNNCIGVHYENANMYTHTILTPLMCLRIKRLVLSTVANHENGGVDASRLKQVE